MRTLIQFLLGSRTAILTLATRPETFPLSLFLVIVAGFVREYGRSNMWEKPWLVGVPLVASILLALVLFPVVEIVARQRGSEGGRFWSRFKVFLSLIWMTAPLAWVFALPVEHFMSPDNAAIVNLWLLGIISLWRIFLLARILGVLFVAEANEIVVTGTIFIVMLVVDTLLLCNLGGNRFVMRVGSGDPAPFADFVMVHLMSVMSFLGIVSWPVWFVGTLALALSQGTRWQWTVSSPVPLEHPVSRGVKCLLGISIVLLALLVPMSARYLRPTFNLDSPSNPQTLDTANHPVPHSRIH